MAWDKLLNRVASAPAKESGPEESEAAVSLADLNPPEPKRETRRSKRVYISMPVLVKFQRGGQPCEEQTVTDSVNAQGCLLRLNVALERGQKITIINIKSTQEMECRVAYVGQSEGGKRRQEWSSCGRPTISGTLPFRRTTGTLRIVRGR